MVDILSFTMPMFFVFVPALLLTVLMKTRWEAFIGFIAIFMFAGALPIFDILPVWFEVLAIVIGGVYLWLSLRGG